MNKSRRRKPTIVQVSPEETLIVFPMRPGVSIGRSCNPPFEEYKHLLSDRPLRPPYAGEPSRGLAGKPNGKPRRKPKASHKRGRKPRAK